MIMVSLAIPNLKVKAPVAVTPQPEVKIVHEPRQPKRPTFSVSLNSARLLEKISGASDKALISFLTGSYETQSDSKKIEKIVDFLIDKVNLKGDFTIILIN